MSARLLTTAASALVLAAVLAAAPQAMAQSSLVKPPVGGFAGQMISAVGKAESDMDDLLLQADDIEILPVYCVGRPPERRDMEDKVKAFSAAVDRLAVRYAGVKQGLKDAAASPIAGPQMIAKGIDPSQPAYFAKAERKLSQLHGKVAELKRRAAASRVSACKTPQTGGGTPIADGPTGVEVPPTELPRRPAMQEPLDYPPLPACFDTPGDKAAWRTAFSAAWIKMWTNYQTGRDHSQRLDWKVADLEQAVIRETAQVARDRRQLADFTRERAEWNAVVASWRAMHARGYDLLIDWQAAKVPCPKVALGGSHVVLPPVNDGGSFKTLSPGPNLLQGLQQARTNNPTQKKTQDAMAPTGLWGQQPFDGSEAQREAARQVAAVWTSPARVDAWPQITPTPLTPTMTPVPIVYPVTPTPTPEATPQPLQPQTPTPEPVPVAQVTSPIPTVTPIAPPAPLYPDCPTHPGMPGSPQHIAQYHPH